MSQDAKALISDIQESMKLPRDNGELVFKTPWEGRIFAMAVLMTEKGVYPWKSFNGKFAREIGEAERGQPEAEMVASYYHHWVKAFEKVLLEAEVLKSEQLETRTSEFQTGRRHHIC
ncbi:nitrile hydratase accessory protein [Paenibacillus abyssi]|uniref:Nitrile hydratase beta subunit-like N-terminal domain-containing protein n=1 Tax=Paenibacillus abyssi TaxID=1340531 RepID=A0A917D1N4_9BACL|nr:nitrile hydratase accessory protein [Paenibacillus abyssi]GGG06591.1 hypothetical protein GCM10010916_24390 [Paenibacillus abyssi]